MDQTLRWLRGPAPHVAARTFMTAKTAALSPVPPRVVLDDCSAKDWACSCKSASVFSTRAMLSWSSSRCSLVSVSLSIAPSSSSAPPAVEPSASTSFFFGAFLPVAALTDSSAWINSRYSTCA